MEATRHPESADSGAAEILGVVLLVGFVLVGATAIVAVGSPALADVERTALLSDAEQTLRALDDGVTADAGRVDLSHVGSGFTRTDDGWLRVQMASDRGLVTVANRSLGAVEYRVDGTSVAYQGGGVWRGSDSRSVLLSAPGVRYEDGTLVLNVFSVGGARGLEGATAVSTRERVRAFPGPGARRNPLEFVSLEITVHSDYYRAWGAYFEQSLPGDVGYDHDHDRVTVRFESIDPGFDVEGIVATSASGELSLEGTGAYTDSYDSSEGTYSTTVGSDSPLLAAGDVWVGGDAAVRGDVRSGAGVHLDGGAVVDGNVSWTTDFEGSASGLVGGDVRHIDGVHSPRAIGAFVHEAVDWHRAYNDNGQTGVISGDRLDVDGSTAELGAGRYYLERLSLAGEELVLNTTQGDVSIAVRDWVSLDRATGDEARITVVGNGTVRMYVGGQAELSVSPTGLGQKDVNFHVGKGSVVDVPAQRSPQFQVYGDGSFDGVVAGDRGVRARFEGVIYAPVGPNGSGFVHVMQADVFGTIVTGRLTLDQYAAVHYDQGIGDDDPVGAVSQVKYLHVTLQRVIFGD